MNARGPTVCRELTAFAECDPVTDGEKSVSNVFHTAIQAAIERRFFQKFSGGEVR
jgi:hypothetical protein